jgi:hypothetical protein
MVSTSTRRIITLLDLLVLIAATGLGLALIRAASDGLRGLSLARFAGARIQSRITAGKTYPSCLLAPWSLALLALYLRAPRSPSQRAARGPGFLPASSRRREWRSISPCVRCNSQ